MHPIVRLSAATLFTALSLGAASHVGAARAPHASATSPKETSVSISNADFTSVPRQVRAGLLRLSVTTTAKSNDNTAEIDIAMVNNPAMKARVAAGMGKGIGAVLPYISFVGGVGEVPGQNRQGIVNLKPGTYVVFNLNGLTANKNPHSPYSFITVTGQATMQEPAVAATVRMVDFKFLTPATVPGGPVTLKLVNNGHEPHEVAVAKLAPGKTMHDVMKALNSPNPPSWVTEVGDWGLLSPGRAQWMETRLIPGHYLLACWVPDNFSYPGHKATHKPHAMLGMMKIITVR